MFQGQSKRLKYWFDIDIYWVAVNYSTRELQFYKTLFQSNIQSQAVSKILHFLLLLEM